MRIVESFGQAAKLGAFAQITRPHREDNVDGRDIVCRGNSGFGIAGGGEQELDEGGGAITTRDSGLLAIAKEFLELIDEDEEALVRREVCFCKVAESGARS